MSHKLIIVILFQLLHSFVYAQVCTITNVNNLSFGNYDVGNSFPLDSVGSITIFCLENEKVTIQFDRGIYSQNFSTRYMKHITLDDLLAYNIYTDPSMTTVWGDGTGGATVTLKFKKNQSLSVNFYGRIPPLQNVSAGNYTDRVIVTILP